ncbi:MAG: DNA repair protein RadC [Candidatus Thermoplasmatota archaeon]|nr:DNA repair protein RadC [Candidatus Thermoplasmatota archaeon]MCG2827385.1 DNA repair protein RadC [Thermoplasmatales archaeon]
MKIKDFPEQNRPRERFLKYGPEALSDAELMAIILRIGTRGSKEIPGENVVDMSNRLIKEYGLDKLFECSLKELQKIKGIGPSKAMQILAMAALGKRYNQSKTPVKRISSAKDVFDLFHERLKDEKQENFYVLMLNTQNYIIEERIISKGTLDKTLIHPREIFRYAIKNAVSKIILVHNHPDGDPTPSKNDLEITEELIKAGNLLGIKVIDHVIIGNKEKWSWKEG